MMDEDVPKLETAEERATRIWRNFKIIRESKTTIPESPVITYPMPANFRKMILEIFAEKRSDIIIQYQIAIQNQRRRLMLEKLKRLERDNADE
jgi:hypothetical protein